MEAGTRVERGFGAGLPAWVLGAVPLALIAVAIGAFALLGGPGLGERTGPPVEEVAVESTVLRPGQIELTLRNDGPDPVTVAQVAVNDAYAPFVAEGGEEIGRLDSTTLDIAYPWIEGEAYEIFVLTSAGGTIEAAIPVATETPEADLDFYALMALLGIYVGVIPVSLGMLWLPFLGRLGQRWIGALIAFTVGLLAYLAIDAGLEGLEIAAEAPAAFGGAGLVFIGALVAYLALAGVDAYLAGRRAAAREPGTEAIEDYAKAIYAIAQDRKGPVLNGEVAQRLGVTPATATSMLKRLDGLGLVDYIPYKGVSLTPAGEKVALEVIRHHRLIEAYLAEALGMPADRVHEEAEVLEHYISEELELLIAAKLGEPSHDPHGTPIPGPDLLPPSAERKPR